MQAFKQYAEVINGCFHIDLPKNFTAKRIELIILSADHSERSSSLPRQHVALYFRLPLELGDSQVMGGLQVEP